MGYCMRQTNSQFYSKNEFHNEAVLRVIADTIEQHERGAGYPWVNPQRVVEAKDLAEILKAWRYQPKLDAQGNITGVEFTGEKSGACHELFKMIAPAVQSGSFIEMLGEDGAKWRWVFDGTTCEEIQAMVNWPTPGEQSLVGLPGQNVA